MTSSRDSQPRLLWRRMPPALLALPPHQCRPTSLLWMRHCSSNTMYRHFTYRCCHCQLCCHVTCCNDACRSAIRYLGANPCVDWLYCQECSNNSIRWPGAHWLWRPASSPDRHGWNNIGRFACRISISLSSSNAIWAWTYWWWHRPHDWCSGDGQGPHCQTESRMYQDSGTGTAPRWYRSANSST